MDSHSLKGIRLEHKKLLQMKSIQTSPTSIDFPSIITWHIGLLRRADQNFFHICRHLITHQDCVTQLRTLQCKLTILSSMRLCIKPYFQSRYNILFFSTSTLDNECVVGGFYPYKGPLLPNNFGYTIWFTSESPEGINFIRYHIEYIVKYWNFTKKQNYKH